MSKIYEISGADAHAMTVSLMDAAQVAAMIPKGASVALKPNLVVAGSPEDVVTLNDPREASDYPRPSGIVARLARNVHADSACSACCAALVRGLYVSNQSGSGAIYIGQGWKGKELSGIGIGNCCAGAAGDKSMHCVS